MGAEVRKEIGSLSEKISGLKAGTKYVIVVGGSAAAKKKKWSVEDAKRAAKKAKEAAQNAKKGLDHLKKAQEALKSGDAQGAKSIFEQARSFLSGVQGAVNEAKSAGESAADAVGAEKDSKARKALETASGGADKAVKFALNITNVFEKAAKAIGSAVEEASARK